MILNVRDISGIDHSKWDKLLKKHVDEHGMVDYKGFLDDRSVLEEYLDHLSQNPPDDTWSHSKLLAFYINLYNAHTIHLILRNYPVQSIKDLSEPWSKSFILLGDEKMSLGEIENGILRKMNEPRIHFAINCASISCPDLLNEAFLPETIEEQLERVTRTFINGPKNDINPDKIKLSRIFKWYRKDFKVNDRKDLIGYLNQYSKILIDPDARIEFIEYDWGLNETNS